MLGLSVYSNPGPPVLQANTLCKERFERRIELPFGISACAATIFALFMRCGSSGFEGGKSISRAILRGVGAKNRDFLRP
jgi:hypothetical protein